MTSEGGGAEAASNSSSFTGTKAGPILSGGRGHDRLLLRRLAPPIAPALARAPYPLENEIGVQPVPTRDRRNRERQAQEPPRRSSCARRGFCRSPPLPSSVLRRHLVSTSDSGGHLIQSKCGLTGGRQITLTFVLEWGKFGAPDGIRTSQFHAPASVVCECQLRLEQAFGRTAPSATDAFSRRPLPRAYRPFIGSISKGSSGSDMARSPSRRGTAAIWAIETSERCRGSTLTGRSRSRRWMSQLGDSARS